MANSKSIIIQNTKMRLSDSSLFKVVMSNDLEFIKKYCDHGKNKKNFLEIMNLGVDPTQLDVDDNGKTALLIAAKNKFYELFNFIISYAMEDDSCKALLAKQLLVKVNTGRNILHEASSIPENGQIINLICQTVKQLHMEEKFNDQLANYINLSDENGYTSLHLTVKNGSYENYLTLILNGVDEGMISIIDNSKLRAIDVYGKDFKRSKIFMLNYLNNVGVPENIRLVGINDFKKRHDILPTNLSSQVLADLIEIDLDMAYKNNGTAQVFASCKTIILVIQLINETPIKNNELNAALSNFSYLNFAAIYPNHITENNDVSLLLLNAVTKAGSFEDKLAKNLFIRAEILKNIVTIATNPLINTSFNKEAFECYTHNSIIKDNPRLSLYGIQQVNLSDINPLLIIKRVAAICGHMSLSVLPTKKSIFSQSSPFAREKINAFLENLKVISLEEASLKSLILDFDTSNNKYLISFKKSMLGTLNGFALFSENDNKLIHGSYY